MLVKKCLYSMILSKFWCHIFVHGVKIILHCNINLATPSHWCDMPSNLRISWLTMALVFLSSCASTGQTSFNEQDSTLEKVNKLSYNATDWVDQYFLKPVAEGYKMLMPDPAEHAVTRAFSNVREAGTAANSLLQGKADQAFHDSGRVLVNSTLGVLGLFDVAEPMGLEKNQPEDFGQTLAVWGVAEGPYIYLPLLGPSTLRDAPSRLVDQFFNPINYLDDSTAKYALNGVDLIQQRATAIEAEQIISGDRYLFIKDAYLQRRQYLINDGELSEEPDDFDTDF